MTDFREQAEKHWEYTGNLLDHTGLGDFDLETVKYLYIEAMIHGYKHGRQDSE